MRELSFVAIIIVPGGVDRFSTRQWTPGEKEETNWIPKKICKLFTRLFSAYKH